MAHRLFMIRKKREKEREKTMIETIMIDSGGRETGEGAVGVKVCGKKGDEGSATWEQRMTKQGSEVCLGGTGSGLSRGEKLKDHYNIDQEHKVGIQQQKGWEHNLPFMSFSTDMLAEGTNDILFAALTLQQAAREGKVMEEAKGRDVTAVATETQAGGVKQNLGYTKASRGLPIPSLGGDETERMVSFDAATFLHSDNEKLRVAGSILQAHTSVAAAAATAPAVAPQLRSTTEQYSVVKDLRDFRGLQLMDQFPVLLPTLQEEDRVCFENGSLLLPRKRGWISSLISSDSSVENEHAHLAKIRAVLSQRDTPRRSSDNPGFGSDLLTSLSNNEAASMPGSEFRSQIVRDGGDVDSANLEEAVARSEMEQVLEDHSYGDSYFYSEVLAEETDKIYLSPYQCELRKNLELFEADPEEVKGSTTPGRKGKVALGQVGLRCCHCAQVDRSNRSKGAVNFSCTVEGIYQIAQNMAKAHLSEKCAHISAEAKKRLVDLRAISIRSYFKNCKKHWGDSIRSRGIYEVTRHNGSLRLMRRPSDVASSFDDSL